MKITFLGTGTSMGVPIAGGFYREQISRDSRNERYRCSAWIQVQGQSILIDAGPEFRLQSIRAEIKHIDTVLITHEHMDHIAGLDDLRAYNYKQEGPLPLYCTQSCADSILKRFDYMFGENKYPGSTSLDVRPVNDKFEIRGGIEVTPLPVMHGKLPIFGFRIGDFSYLTDVKDIPAETKDKIRGSKIMVLSALRWDPPHPTHLTIPEALAIAEELEISKTYFIHMNGAVDHTTTTQKLPDHARLAYDQMVIEL